MNKTCTAHLFTPCARSQTYDDSVAGREGGKRAFAGRGDRSDEWQSSFEVYVDSLSVFRVIFPRAVTITCKDRREGEGESSLRNGRRLASCPIGDPRSPLGGQSFVRCVILVRDRQAEVMIFRIFAVDAYNNSAGRFVMAIRGWCKTRSARQL